MKKSALLAMMILRIVFCGAQDNNKAFNADYSSQNAKKIPAKTYALIVGIDSYQNPRLTHLKYAAADAIAFKDFLMSKAGGNTPIGNIKLRLNDSATFGKFTTDLTWLRQRVKSGDRLFLYFSGHGTTVSGSDAYFLLYNLADVVNEENIQAVLEVQPGGWQQRALSSYSH